MGIMYTYFDSLSTISRIFDADLVERISYMIICAVKDYYKS